MAINGVSNMINNKFRLSGLATGLDTDTIISDLMRAERVPLDKVLQKRQLAEWKRDSYRDITNLLRGLKDQFFDVLKPSSYMLSQTNYKKFTASSTDSTVVTATGGPSASAGSHKIAVTNLATSATVKSSGTVTKTLESTDIITTGAGSDVVNAGGKKIKVTLDGVTKEITLGSYTDISTVGDLALDIQNRIGLEFGTGKVAVGEAGGKLTFTTEGGASKLTFENSSTNNGLGYLHITPGSSNRISTSDTIDTLRDKLITAFDYKTEEDGTQNVVFTINSKTFTFSKNTTLSSMMNTINSDATAKVNMAYDDVSDRFIITSKQSGSGNSIHLSEDTGTFLASAGFKSYTGSEAAALSYTNEKFNVSIDGVLKEFTLNGSYASHADLALDIQNKIRNEFAGKTVTVSANTDNTLSFSLDSTGSTLSVGVTDPGVSALGFKNANYTFGEDSQFVLDGQNVTRSSNTFTSNGVTYTLLKESGTEQTVSLNQDIKDTVCNIHVAERKRYRANSILKSGH
jgi:flagellar hook-associated protein 2